MCICQVSHQLCWITYFKELNLCLDHNKYYTGKEDEAVDNFASKELSYLIELMKVGR